MASSSGLVMAVFFAGRSPRLTAARRARANGGSAASLPQAPIPAERFGLAAGQRPPTEVTQAVRDAFWRDHAVAVERPAVPFRPQRAEVTTPQQAQQLDRRPRHAPRSSIPRPHRPHAAAQHSGASLPAQQAAEPQITKTIGGEVPRATRPTVPPMAQRNSTSLGLGRPLIDANAYCVKLYVRQRARGKPPTPDAWPYCSVSGLAAATAM